MTDELDRVATVHDPAAGQTTAEVVAQLMFHRPSQAELATFHAATLEPAPPTGG